MTQSQTRRPPGFLPARWVSSNDTLVELHIHGHPKKYGILLTRMKPVAGFREHAHIADWELEVWAPDMPGLLEQAARGMYTLMGLKLQSSMAQSRSIDIQGEDAESLLVRFLTELLWFIQQEWMGFEEYKMTITAQNQLHATLQGRKISSLEKEIKAVTYHNLEVVSTGNGLSVTIVFDV